MPSSADHDVLTRPVNFYLSLSSATGLLSSLAGGASSAGSEASSVVNSASGLAGSASSAAASASASVAPTSAGFVTRDGALKGVVVALGLGVGAAWVL